MIKNKEFMYLIKTVNFYKREADKCGDNKCYFAACIMYASALEAMLLARIDLATNKKQRGHLGGVLFKYIEELQEILEEKFSKDAHEIREIRNLLHPGRVIRTKKVLKNRKKDYLKIYKKIQRISEQLLETI